MLISHTKLHGEEDLVLGGSHLTRSVSFHSSPKQKVHLDRLSQMLGSPWNALLDLKIQTLI